MPVPLQNSFDLVHARQMVARRVFEPGDSARLSTIVPFRCRSVESCRPFQVLFKPRKILPQHDSVCGFDVRRIPKLVRQGKGAILDPRVWMPSGEHESNEPHRQGLSEGFSRDRFHRLGITKGDSLAVIGGSYNR